MSGFAPARNISVDNIMDSLERRGFIPQEPWLDVQAVQTQVDAVLEELGEVARILRRDRQGREQLDIAKLANEGADLVIASVCLLSRIAGYAASEVIADKLAADEQRGWLHSGMSREAYEAQR